MKKEMITVKTIDGDIEIQAETKGDWAIHKTLSFGKSKTYSLTHIPSGLSVIRRCRFKKTLISFLPRVIETANKYPNLPNKKFYQFLINNFDTLEIF